MTDRYTAELKRGPLAAWPAGAPHYRAAYREARARSPVKKDATLHGGSIIDCWVLTERLGQGSFSEVWAARPATTSADCPADYAVKVLLGDGDKVESSVIASLAREKALGQQLSHPHLVPVLDGHVQAGGRSYLLMPRLRGALVSNAVRAVGPFVVPHALWVARQVSEALAVLHSAGWAHGDIKPDNVHVTAEGHATLLDLGMACRFSQPWRDTANESAGDLQRGGSLAYMAPERLVLRSQVTAQSDIYSLGITLYCMLVGTHPFSCRTPGQWVAAHLTQPVTPPHEICAEIPESVSSLVSEMLRKEPLRRPSSCEELRDRLVPLEAELLPLRMAARPTTVVMEGRTAPQGARSMPHPPHRRRPNIAATSMHTPRRSLEQ